MKEKHIQILSVVLTLVYGVCVAWLYWAAPKNLEEVSSKARHTIESATTKAKVVTKTYEVDRVKFDEGLKAFRNENFILARDLFERADKQKLDSRTQFYIAYSYYRQGWGRFSNNDELFQKALESVNRVTRLDENFKANDPGLKLSTPVELKNELEEGLRVTADDFNPFKFTRERK